MNRTEINELGEFGIIDKIKSNFKKKKSSTVISIGDDAAAIRSGKDLVLDLTVSVQGGGVTVTAVKTRGTAFKIGDTITVDNVNVGGSGSGFQLTVSEISLEAVCRTDAAHQVKSGDIVWFSGMNDSAYLGDSTVVRSETARKFTILVNNYNASTPNPIITSAVTSVREPQFQFINGHSYKFDTSSATLNGVTLAFSFDPSNTDIFTYKNITDEDLINKYVIKEIK